MGRGVSHVKRGKYKDCTEEKLHVCVYSSLRKIEEFYSATSFLCSPKGGNY